MYSFFRSFIQNLSSTRESRRISPYKRQRNVTKYNFSWFYLLTWKIFISAMSWMKRLLMLKKKFKIYIQLVLRDNTIIMLTFSKLLPFTMWLCVRTCRFYCQATSAHYILGAFWKGTTLYVSWFASVVCFHSVHSLMYVHIYTCMHG